MLGIMHFYNLRLLIQLNTVVPRTIANADGTSTLTIPGPVTTEEKAQKKNDVKARRMLLMALRSEHLLTFIQYKDAKTLFKAIQARFSGNDATKNTQRTILNQMYKNFNALSIKSLDYIFNRLQKVVSQLSILGENISQEDLNMKFSRSLPSKWNTHVVVSRNKADLDAMSIDDLYNNLKLLNKNTNEVDTAIIQVSVVSTPVSTDLYDPWKSRMELYMLNRPHGRMILESVEQGPLIWPSVEVEGVTRLNKYSKLSAAETIQADCDVKATNIILQGLPPEVYAL
nr:ribonuclease H-like domain-containing protein [Tanacetum cinerariifolium]